MKRRIEDILPLEITNRKITTDIFTNSAFGRGIIWYLRLNEKNSYIFIYLFFMLFLFSCGHDENLDTEKIQVINQTEEDVRIYYYVNFFIKK